MGIAICILLAAIFICVDLEEGIKKITAALAEISKPSHNTTQAEICQIIVEDQLNFLINTGMCFRDDEKIIIRDNLYRIIVGKLSAVR